MKKIVSIVVLFISISCISNAKTIEWKADDAREDLKEKYIVVSEQVTESKNVSIKQLEYDIQQYDARIEHLQGLKADAEAELAEIKTVLKLEEVDGAIKIIDTK